MQHTDIPPPQSATLGLHPVARKLLLISRLWRAWACVDVLSQEKLGIGMVAILRDSRWLGIGLWLVRACVGENEPGR